jgi:hypothetical protein
MSNELLVPNSSWWFPELRESLIAEWQNQTTIPSPHGGTDSLACSLLHSINPSTGHLSIACSLSSETDQIEKLLTTDCFNDDPVLFFRLLLFLLDEFTARLEECYCLLGHPSVPKQPSLISIWTNRYAKHRTTIAIQHHAQHVFSDDPCCDRHLRIAKTKASLTIIDTDWLKTNTKVNISVANQSGHAIVVVPKFWSFVVETINYYRAFRDYACSNPRMLQQFQSPYHLGPLDPPLFCF